VQQQPEEAAAAAAAAAEEAGVPPRWLHQIPDYRQAPADAIMLYCPGKVLHLQRRGADEGAVYTMVSGAANPAFGRILVHRSMLRDHYLAHYEAALQHLLEQLGQAAPAVEAPAAAAPEPQPAA
jgi:hypothetical protein